MVSWECVGERGEKGNEPKREVVDDQRKGCAAEHGVKRCTRYCPLRDDFPRYYGIVPGEVLLHSPYDDGDAKDDEKCDDPAVAPGVLLATPGEG